MFATIKSATLGGIGALALASSSTFAAPVPWSNPNGAGTDASWSNGQSDNGLFGSPTVDANGTSFLFFPSNFKAQSTNGVAQTTSDRLSFTLTAAPGKQIQQVKIHELGDWSILNGGSVKASGALYITKLNVPGFGTVWSDTLDTVYKDVANNITYNPPSQFPNAPGNGTWDGDFVINLPTGVTSVQVVLNNILQATSTASGTSFIQKKVVGTPGGDTPQFKIDLIVPEPTSLSFLGLGGIALLRRSRRKTKVEEASNN